MSLSLLLFKSTGEWEYRQRILTALSLPRNVYWDTTYEINFLGAHLQSIIEKNPSELNGKKGVLFFIDLQSEEKIFVPLRKFQVLRSEKEGNFWKIRLIFTGYFNNFSEINIIRNKLTETNIIRNKLTELILENTQASKLAFLVDKELLNDKDFSTFEEDSGAFQNIANYLINQPDEKCFKKCSSNGEYDCKGSPAVFSMLKLSENIRCNNGKAILKPDRAYTLTHSYFAPEGAPFLDQYNMYFGICSESQKNDITIAKGTKFKSFDVEFRVSRKKGKHGHIQILRSSCELLAPFTTINYEIEESFWEKHALKLGIIPVIVGIFIAAMSTEPLSNALLAIPMLKMLSSEPVSRILSLALIAIGASIIGRAH